MKKTTPTMFRQGDVLVVAIEQIPAHAERIGRADGKAVLAYGEATGHAHEIAEPGADLYATWDDELFLRVAVSDGVALTHQEHHTIELPPGTYRVVRQREYSPTESRLVAD